MCQLSSLATCCEPTICPVCHPHDPVPITENSTYPHLSFQANLTVCDRNLCSCDQTCAFFYDGVPTNFALNQYDFEFHSFCFTTALELENQCRLTGFRQLDLVCMYSCTGDSCPSPDAVTLETSFDISTLSTQSPVTAASAPIELASILVVIPIALVIFSLSNCVSSL